MLDAATRLMRAGTSSVVIAGAATAGMARRLRPAAPVQLLDGIRCAVRQAELLAGMGEGGSGPLACHGHGVRYRTGVRPEHDGDVGAVDQPLGEYNDTEAPIRIGASS